MSRPFAVLLVEDDPEDVELTREVLQRTKLNINIAVVPDGREAMAYLHGRPPYADAARPNFILLDLNMPRVDGKELLQQMAADEQLKAMPVVIFTTSAAEADMLKCYDLGASYFITKPVGLKQFREAANKIESFWLAAAKLADDTHRA